MFSELVAIFFFVVCFAGEVFHWPWSRTQILDTLSKKLYILWTLLNFAVLRGFGV